MTPLDLISWVGSVTGSVVFVTVGLSVVYAFFRTVRENHPKKFKPLAPVNNTKVSSLGPKRNYSEGYRITHSKGTKGEQGK